MSLAIFVIDRYWASADIRWSGVSNVRVWWNVDIAISRALSLSSTMDWSQIAPDFKPDGSLRDIYILGASIDDWALIWNVLTTSDRLAFDVDGIARTPPADVREAFALHASHSVTACYRLGRQRLNCHFFVEEEVEFDLDPGDVDGLVEAERLGQFLVDLGRMTSKEVRLTAENEREAVIARYSPTSDSVVWSRAPYLHARAFRQALPDS
jgi:hypothetical protein